MKKTNFKKILTAILVVVMCLSVAGCSVSKPNEASNNPGSEDAKIDYPTKPITMIVPYGAGGGTDTYGRMLAAQLEKKLGVSVTVTNQGGASGSIGTKFVHDADADGYTLLFSAETIGTYRSMGTSDLSYNNFIPVALAVNDPKLVVVSKNSKYNTLEELLDDIKANPNKITMSHSGPGGSGHNQGLILKELGYEVAMTAYDSGNNALLGVLGDQVAFTNPNLSFTTGYISSGDVKVLAVFSNERLKSYPDIPAFTEIVPESEKYLSIPLTPLSLLAKEGTPSDVVEILRKATSEAFQETDWVEFVESNSADKLYEKYTDEESMKQFFKNWESMICWLQYDNGVAKNSPEKFNIPKLD
ncbi:tripartite-type tricarboxylate transporter receptor subunit TctC [Sedimentibacter acidaminivorans]|uniref:Tripartite-type tricarboxylate transporter receptor subunit TctC n=1 Tax=Sedimentibacter acidaminivorans TaxID=913099 RepID=A0ABS4G9M8_9FIRM|nr:tripartite tricarboxylate transporter substrate binding protein [Sedimentibacter acidaminivorans]MBP1924398.1 tripartite-type tricarboxylate transporter receptor subunit TctC [Sedimentibacter acidaminivorans]